MRESLPTTPPAHDAALPLVQIELKRPEPTSRARPKDPPTLHFHRPVEHVFTDDQRERTTVLIGGLSPRHDRLLEASIQALGYKCSALPNVSLAGYEIAKEYGNNGQCNPTYFTVGALVKYVQDLEAGGLSREEIIDSYVFVTAGSCGTCRFGMYEAEYRLALANAGFEGFRVLLFGTDDGIDQSTGQKAGLDMNLDFFLGLITAFNIADVLNQFRYQLRAYEVVPDSVDEVTDRVLDHLSDFIRSRKRFELEDSAARFLSGSRFAGTANYLGKIIHQLRSRDFVEAVEEARQMYDEVEVDPFRVRPIVKVIGEFWAQTTEGDGNFNMHRFLDREGAEVFVDRSLFTRLTYLLHMHKQATLDRKGLHKGEGRFAHYLGHYKKRGILTLAERILKYENDRLLKAMGGTLHEMADQYELAEIAKPYWNWRTSSGESHLEIAENIYYHTNHLCHMVLSLKPFTCMPSTQSDGVQAKVVEEFSGMIFLPIETSGDGEVIAHSRVQMALGAARVKARNEMNEAVERTGRTLDELKAYVAGKAEMRSPTYPIPHSHGVVGRAANFALHVGEVMDQEAPVASARRSA